MVEGKRSVKMVEAFLLLLLITGSLQKPAMAVRPLGGKKLGFVVESLEDLFLESLPKGPQPPSHPSCETHSNIPCPPPQK
ncbi:hypothetical protein MA16_Dca011638 [Dendrobium catenatum]|uniref:Uncharacterized protein n=1 Tax=Dendrobium catenatum TaxID=906689 RepID=A0A2I0WQS7_9ASPA|nr:hypothetical protein MA16_Dca011638 [Dendrobium catenatum]